MQRRASSSPLFDKCQAAAYGDEDEVRLNRIDDYGVLGTATHKACEQVVLGEGANTGAIAAEYNLTEPAKIEMIKMIAAFTRWWADAREFFPEPEVEREFKTEGLTGHTDIISMNTEIDVTRVADIKTTRLADVDYTAQGLEYLWLASETEPYKLASGYQFTLVFVRDWSASHSTVFTKAELDEWHNDLEARILNWDGKTYQPSGACWYCGRCATCPGLQRQIVQTHGMLDVPDVEAAIAILPDAEKVELWDRLGLAIKLFDHCRGLLKLEAAASDNRRLVGDTRDLVLVEQIRRPLKAMEAWPILTTYLRQAELAPAVKISKTVALAAIASKAPRGQKGKIRQQVTAELEAAGALDEKIIVKAVIQPSLAAANETLIEGA